MNQFNFDGRLAKAPALSGRGEAAVAKLTLIRNDYAGKDKETNATRERQVAIPFTAFRAQAEAIAEHCMKGDQLIVTARIENNVYTKDGEDRYDYNFVIESFDFGAPGEAKRAELAKRHATHA